MKRITLAVSSYCFTIFAAATALAAPQSASPTRSVQEVDNSGTLMFRPNESLAAQRSCPRGAVTLQSLVAVEAGTKMAGQERQRFVIGLEPRIASLPLATVGDRDISGMTATAEPAMPFSVASDTEMFSFAEEITPVPESRTWFAGFLAACAAAWMTACRTNMRGGRLLKRRVVL
jgi:hypothetical protein